MIDTGMGTATGDQRLPWPPDLWSSQGDPLMKTIGPATEDSR